MAVTNRDDRNARKPPKPLDGEALQRLALAYVGRYATSRGKLVDYLRRKVLARGWQGDAPDYAALAGRLADLGYIDDKAFAEGRARSLGARGYGKRRVRQALRTAGIAEEDCADASEVADEGRWAAALRFAQKRRIGPYAAAPADRSAREKAIGAMIRAGHDFATSRAIASAAPGEIPDDVSQ